jgi:hypothetical protein
MHSTRQPKAKKSFTLSRSSVAFLHRLWKEKKATSISRIVDELIEDARARRQLEAYEQAVSDYYDNLTDEERQEQRAWAELSRRAWRKEPIQTGHRFENPSQAR